MESRAGVTMRDTFFVPFFFFFFFFFTFGKKSYMADSNVCDHYFYFTLFLHISLPCCRARLSYML